MKYKIVLGGNDLLPYRIYRKNEKSFFSIWRYVTSLRNQHEAESLIERSVARHSKYPIGSTILEYDESDLVVARLKDDQNKGAVGAQYDSGMISKTAAGYVNVVNLPNSV